MTINLYPFQQEDIEHLRTRKSALIINDMGTGKTYEAVARDDEIRAQEPEMPHTVRNRGTLVIGPLTILEDVWQTHFHELTKLTCVVVNPKDRAGSWTEFLSRGDVFCIHWEGLRLMPELQKFPWLHIIADECHRAKNRKAQQTRALKMIKGEWKTAMSGTPVINRPDEFWSILNWLYPDKYRSYWKFFNHHVEYEMVQNRGRAFRKIVGPKNTAELQTQIAPFSVRRRKQDVLKDLPDKYYTTLTVDLSPQQLRAYNTMKKDMIAWIGKQEEEILAAPVVIAQLTRLQQFACTYAELSDEGRVRMSEPSSKLDRVMEVVDETEEQVVVFSRFKQVVNLLANRLKEQGTSYVTLTGDVAQADRSSVVQRFQSGQARIFLGSI